MESRTEGERHRYLIIGSPRAQLADALLEYRAFAENHPGEPLAEKLLEVSRHVRLALREARRVARLTGDPGKVNAHCKLNATERRKLQRRRRDRLAKVAA